MEDVEQEAGAARPGAHDAPDAVAAHDTIDTAEAHAVKAAATAAPKRPKSAEEIMRLVLDKAGSSTVKTFGGGKKAKVGVFAVPGVQDASVMASKVNIYENVYPSVLCVCVCV